MAHEAYKKCGVGAEITAQIVESAFDYLDAPIIRVASKDIPIPFNEPEETAVIAREAELIKAVKEMI